MKNALAWLATIAVVVTLFVLGMSAMEASFVRGDQQWRQRNQRACSQYAEITGQATRFIQSENPEADSCWINDHGFTRKLQGDELPW